MKRSKITLVFFLLMLAGLVGVNLFMFFPFLVSILIGGFLSLVIRPLYERLLLRWPQPSLMSLFITLSLLLLVVIPTAALLFYGIQELLTLAKQLMEHPPVTKHYVSRQLSRIPGVSTFVGDTAQISDHLTDWSQQAATFTVNYFMNFIKNSGAWYLQIIIILISFYFLLRDGRAFVQWLKERLPLDPDVRNTLFRSIADMSVSTLVSTVLASLAQAIIMWIAFVALSIPDAYLAAGATFVFSWLPLVGSSVIWIPIVVYFVAKGLYLKAVGLILFGLLTSVADNLVRAYVLKGQAGLHPYLGLISIFGGIQLFGLAGVFIGPVVVSALIALLNVWPRLARDLSQVSPPAGPEITVVE